MGKLDGRVRRLEAARAEAGCRACSGVTIVMDGDGPPRPCPACGSIPERVPFTIRITNGPDDGERAGWAG